MKMIKKFKKVVEWKETEEYSMISYYILMTLTLIFTLFFIAMIASNYPEFNHSFFPLGYLAIGWVISFIFSLIPMIKRKVYWVEIK